MEKKHILKQGATAAWPICLGYFPVGLALGVLAQQAGIPVWAVGVMSVLVFAGSAIGAGIGVSLGVLLFSALRSLNGERCYNLCLLLLAFIGAGMVMQASLLLEQADWISAGQPLWNSSALLSEQSIAGELMYAVLGYESTPSAVQVGLYILSLSGMLLAWYLGCRYKRSYADE